MTSGRTSWATPRPPRRTARRARTVDVTHALEDGGARELAYVAMSRARHESHVHVVAPSIAHAAEHLAWAWGQERREAWALEHQLTKSLAELHHEQAQLARSIPPTVRPNWPTPGAVCC